MLALSEYVKILVALLVIVNPIGAIPLFVLITEGETALQRERTAWIASVSVAVVLAASVLMGEGLLHFFGITIASFKVGGSILLLLMAISMMEVRPLREKQTPEEAAEAEDKESVAVVPLAIPLLAGPGAMSTTIIYSAAAHSWGHTAVVILLCLAVATITWGTLRAGVRVGGLIGRTGLNIATRVMGLLLAAVAVEIFASGIVELLPGLGTGV